MENCKICNKNKSKYSCPKCNLLYCSLDCYKNESHSECTEEFYKKNIQEELSLRSIEDANSADKKKIYEILNRVNNEDFLYDGEDDIEDIDSDDDVDEDISVRLQGIDINDSEELWKQLTEEERQVFQNLVNNGDILNLIPEFIPWWEQKKKIIEVGKSESTEQLPEILKTIPDFDKLTTKPVSPCLHFNTCNILGSYTTLVRYFNGEHHLNPLESIKYLINLSKTLKSNENFENYESCLESILSQIEEVNLDLGLEYQDLNKDLQVILVHYNSEFILRGLSDVYSLFYKAKKELSKNGEQKVTNEFSKRFGPVPKCEVSKGSVTLILKKLEFLMAAVIKTNK
ncbi:ZNHIT2 family protein [Megaselia abdita]